MKGQAGKYIDMGATFHILVGIPKDAASILDVSQSTREVRQDKEEEVVGFMVLSVEPYEFIALNKFISDMGWANVLSFLRAVY